MEFNERLKGLRKKSGMTQAEMSEKIGVERSTYAGYESGNRMPGMDLVRKISIILNVSFEFLAFGTEEDKIRNEKLQSFKLDLLDKFLRISGYRLEYLEEDAFLFLIGKEEYTEIQDEELNEIFDALLLFLKFQIFEIFKDGRRVFKIK